MAHASELKKQLAEMDLPEDQTVRARAEMFMLRSGHTAHDLANKIGYSHISLRLFLSGKYNQHWKRDCNTLNIRARLLDYLDSVELPVNSGPRGTLYLTESYAKVRKAFYRALNHRADNHGYAYCFDGAPGMQKSYIAESLVRELAEADAAKNGHGRRAYYIYCGENTPPMEMLKMLAVEMGIPASGFIEQLIKKIQFELATRRALIVIDEAHHLRKDTVERIRQLLDRPPHIGFLFLGSHDVLRVFADLKMEQWRRRTVDTVVLTGLTRDEAVAIIRGEFGDASEKKIDGLIERCIVPDPRRPLAKDETPHTYPYERVHQGRRYEAYLSAGALFAAINQYKLDKQDQEEAAHA